METTFTYERPKYRWLLAIEGQEVKVFCDGEQRIYTIPEKIINTKQTNEYVEVFVKDNEHLTYQFKFEEDKFLVCDIYDVDGDFVDTFASFVFDED